MIAGFINLLNIDILLKCATQQLPPFEVPPATNKKSYNQIVAFFYKIILSITALGLYKLKYHIKAMAENQAVS